MSLDQLVVMAIVAASVGAAAAIAAGYLAALVLRRWIR